MSRELPPTSRFAGDDGSADTDLALALAEPDAGRRRSAVVHALARARVLVPVVAHLEESEESADGAPAGDKSASAAMVTLATPDGRGAVPVFSSMDSLRTWRPDARPIPVEAVRAALASVSDADGVLVVDPAGPVTVQVPRPAVWALAQQQSWVPAATDAQVQDRIAAVVGALAGVVSVRVEPGDRSEVRVVLALQPGLAREQVQHITAEAGRLLAGEEVVAQRIDSLEFQVRSA